jgi:hypothetical protein
MFFGTNWKKVHSYPIQNFFFVIKGISCGVYENDPLSPPKGEATCEGASP